MVGSDVSAVDAWLRMSASDRLQALAVVQQGARLEADSHHTYSATAKPKTELPEGSLGGFPMAIKESIDAVGLPTHTETSIDRGTVAEIDAAIVATLRLAGATFVGKTSSFEVAFAPATTGAGGPALNPIDPTRIAGGSSGASAATVAMGTVPLSLATDTSGSMLVSASLCGVVGYRATVGRYPTDGVRRHSWTRDAIGFHARTTRDIESIDQLVSLESSAFQADAPDVVLGVVRSRFKDVDRDVKRVMDGTLGSLVEAGVRLVDVDVPREAELSSAPGISLVLWEAERLITARATARFGRTPRLDELMDAATSPDVKGLLTAIQERSIDSRTYAAAQRSRAALRRIYHRLFEELGLQALVYPTCPIVAPAVGAEVVNMGEESLLLRMVLVRNTTAGSVSGLPMISLPAGTTFGMLPVGVCLEARPWADRSLLRVARYVEEVLSP